MDETPVSLTQQELLGLCQGRYPFTSDTVAAVDKLKAALTPENKAILDRITTFGDAAIQGPSAHRMLLDDMRDAIDATADDA